ncbi:LysR substrate-binding domain-containing protein [Methylobacterium dankookense]|uniref:HTH-type transcriptional regulator PerR n=1 Tax=Methylobacterium dankookense TaxID=560405 RepID=A0A564G7I2_9HYPH|nr:LysR substrate-binding domain-containing protein [Methylobacterium dankookense]GJD57587.1 HTH-type transcriptional regulator PerR [Methylobacterium dankookense]VUF15501.1 HTH-type transcriptional regulator PerR [Methylobacterium dankookense]
MQHLPSLHALRAFEAAARLGSFARAGEELRLTPSAISHQVRALEQHLGRPLFVRANRQVLLTPEGERLLAVLSQAFGAIRAVCAEISPPARTRELAVHCTPSFAAKWLGPRLPGFIARQPAINIRMSSNAEPLDLLRHDEIDVVISYGAAAKESGLTTHTLGFEEIAALCSPAFDRAHQVAALEDFEALVRLESSFSPVRWSDWFALNRLPMPASRTGPAFDRGSLVISAAAQGLGLALESLCFAQAEIDAGLLVRFGGDRFESIRRNMHFLTYRTRDESAPKIRHFCEWIIGEAAP